MACILLGNWKKIHDITEFLHWSKLDVKKKMDIENELRMALSMSSFTSELPINLKITYSPMVSKNVLLAMHCSRDSPILLANTRNKKVNWETVSAVLISVGQLLIIAAHRPVAFGEPLNFLEFL